MDKTLDDIDIIRTAKKIASQYRLCDHCLGRCFAKIEHGLTNKERGQKIRKKLNKKPIKTKNCWLCEGLLDEIKHFAELVTDKLKNYEFETYLIGSIIDEDIIEKEQHLQESCNPEYTEPLKTEINREVGKLVGEHTCKTVNFFHPDITIMIDTAFDGINLQIKPLYIYGKYLKLIRGIPQTRWFCRICRGKGCRRCEYTGKLYETSVEELIAVQALKQTNGSDEAFHGSGREDIDALMLGDGRPFILEIKHPQKREIDVSSLEKKINAFAKGKIEIKNLRFSDKNEVVKLKNTEFKKTYHAVIYGEKPINKEKLNEAAQVLRGKIINQQTPQRVTHRRADLTRKKRVLNCTIEALRGRSATLLLETEGGLYIKELVSGDNGRTQPNISDMIDNPCMVKELDVLKIEGE